MEYRKKRSKFTETNQGGENNSASISIRPVFSSFFLSLISKSLEFSEMIFFSFLLFFLLCFSYLVLVFLPSSDDASFDRQRKKNRKKDFLGSRCARKDGYVDDMIGKLKKTGCWACKSCFVAFFFL